MFPSIRGLARRPSMESFVSPIAQTSDASPGFLGNAPIRRLRSMSQLQQSRKSLPQISPLLVTRTATVHVRHKMLGWTTWPRQSLRLTKHTISLHRYPDSDVLDIIVLRRVRHVERFNDPDHPCCLRLETIEDKTHYFAFDSEEELYNWLTDIHLGIVPCGKPTNVTHLLHVEPDRSNKHQLIGLPEDWKTAISGVSPHDIITRDMVEAALPELSFPSYPDPIIDFIQELPGCRPDTPDSQLEYEDEAVILQAQRAMRAVNQRFLDLHPQPSSSLKIITAPGYSFYRPAPSGLLSATTASEDSPLTPVLTPDTSNTPLTPFRESPYRYRESDAQDLSGQILKQSEWPAAHGGYADIWKALWERDRESPLQTQVAVKVLRVLSQDGSIKAKIHKRLCKEVRVWHQLRHKNIVQMYGTCEGFGPLPSMVSAWYENGNVNTYLRKLGDATVDKRLKLLTEVACGLNYLHSFVFPVAHDMTTKANIVHGDLKGANILVNGHGEAALADFGLSSVIAVAGKSTTSTFSGGSVRWMAPELLVCSSEDVMSKTCASDTYSYGSVVLEIMTGERPYKDIPNDMQVIKQLMDGYRPRRPSKPILNSGVWDLMERCWNTTPSDRPNMAFVLSRMEKFYNERRKSVISHFP